MELAMGSTWVLVGAKVHDWADGWESGTRFVSECAPVLVNMWQRSSRATTSWSFSLLEFYHSSRMLILFLLWQDFIFFFCLSVVECSAVGNNR
jgi:hypothetical protein